MTDAPELLIIWHSRTGTARAMAEAALEAALHECPVRMIAAEEVQPEDMLAASGYLFVCPENLATMSGAMKEFFDRCYYPLLGRIEGRPYAAMVAAGSDGAGAVRQIERIATGWRLRRVADSLIVFSHAQTAEAIAAPKYPDAAMLEPCREMGAMLGAGLALGIF